MSSHIIMILLNVINILKGVGVEGGIGLARVKF